MARKTGYFVMDSMERTLTYGVTVYQVWSVAVGPLAPMDAVNSLEYETSSKAKANAVCEYLTLKAEQETLAQQLTWEKYQQGGVDERTFIPHSIKC